jgi:flagellar hook-associated protein 2
MAISSTGIGSGLDVTTIVSSLVRNQFDAPQQRLADRLSLTNTQISALGKIKSSLFGLQTAFTNLSDIQKIYAMQVKSSDETILTATTSSKNNSAGSYQMEVQQIAQQHSLATDYIGDVNHVGSGTLTISLGKYNGDKTAFTSSSSTQITIAPGNDSLTSIRDAINNSDAEVTASIVKDASGSRLTIISNKTGEDYAVQVATTDPALSALKYDPTDQGLSDGLTQTIAALNSKVKINGLLLEQNSNQLDEAINGLNINLKKAAPGTTVKIDVSNNTEQVSTLVSDFVKKYNDTISMLKNLTDYNSTTKKSGDMANDPQLRTLTSSLKQLVTGTFATWNTNLKTVADIGIKTNKSTGLLDLDQATLQKALTDNYQEVGALFAKSAITTDSNVDVSTLSLKVKAGTYAVELSEFTAGVSVAGTIGGLSASSSGTTLSSSGILLGLSLKINAGSSGSRGTITVSDGIGVLANNILEKYTQNAGLLDQNVSTLNNNLRDLNKRSDTLEDKRIAAQTRYMKQFQALDLMLSNLQSTNVMLTQQLTALNKL